MSDLNELFKAAAEEKRKLREQEENTPAAKALRAVQERLKVQNDIAAIFEATKPFVEDVLIKEEIPPFVPSEPTPTGEPGPNDMVAAAITVANQQMNTDSFQQPAEQPIDPNFAAMIKKMQFLEQAIGKIAATGPGSGEVNLRWLDDVDRNTIEDNKYLRYSSATKKFIFDDVDSVGEYCTLWDKTTQTITANTHNLITISDHNGQRNISVVDGSKITFTKAGTYNVNYSLQIVNADSVQNDLNVFLKKNGVNVVDSNSIFTVPGRKNTNIHGKLVATSPIPVDVEAGDYIQIYAHTDDPLLTIASLDLDAVHNIPAAPGVIIIVTKL